MKNNYYDYFTVWTLIVSYSILLLCIIFNKRIPLWVLLFGTCLLTSTIIIGTFFHNIVNIDYKSERTKKKKKLILLKDFIAHIGPFVVFMLFFPFLVRRTSFNPRKPSKYVTRNYRGRKCEPLASEYFFLSLIPAIALICIYLAIYNPDFIYENDSIDIITKIVLSVAIFCSSYQILFNWSRVILNF